MIVHGVKGPLYMDGSCFRHICKELSRAAWCIVALDVECKLRYCLSGPVFAPFPQTPQAGEYMAAAVSCQVGEPGFVGKSDCWNVVRDMGRPVEEQLHQRRAYGAMLRDRLSNKGKLAGAAPERFEWVPAHVEPESVTGQERVDAIANGLADLGAKAAVKDHPLLMRWSCWRSRTTWPMPWRWLRSSPRCGACGLWWRRPKGSRPLRGPSALARKSRAGTNGSKWALAGDAASA